MAALYVGSKPEMEIVDKEKWAEYKRGRRVEVLFVFPLMVPFILIGEGYWYLALLVLAFTVYLSSKAEAFKVAQEIIIGFKYKYFSLVGLMFACGLLNWFYPNNDDLIWIILLSIFISFASCYFAIIKKVKSHILGSSE